MSNICPQHKDLNRGLWQTLEHRIVNNYAPARDHIWVVSGPIFEQDIGQVNGVDIPTHFYMILVDVGQWPAFRPYIMAFKFPQQASANAQLSDFLVSVNHIEEKTNLNFFPQFDDAQESDYETDPANEV